MLTEQEFLDAISASFATTSISYGSGTSVMCHPRYAERIRRWNAFNILNRIRPLSEASLAKIKVPKGVFRG